MGLIILTKSPKSNWADTFSDIKIIIKKIFRQNRGQDLIVEYLSRGLNLLGKDYQLNPNIRDIVVGGSVYVNKSFSALRWAISEKKAGRIAKLIVGPVFTVLPNEAGGVLLDESIDVIIVPSLWVFNLWRSIAPDLEKKMVIWPVGIPDSGERKGSGNKLLVYQKDCSKFLLKNFLEVIKKRKIKYELVRYGRYRHGSYLKKLDSARGAVFLSRSESQGIALLEAWMKNVPTLIWSPGEWNYRDVKWLDENISAPYFSKDCGVRFSGVDDFSEGLDFFMNNLESFSPRKYALSNFSLEKCASDFLRLV